MKMWCVFFVLWMGISLPSLPSNPEVVSPQVPDVVWPDKELFRKDVAPPTNTQMHLFQVEVVLYGHTNSHRGLWKLSRDTTLVVTNATTGVMEVFTLSLYDVEHIEILSWRVGMVSNSWYEFVPHQVRLISQKGKTNEGTSDWRWLFRIPIEKEEKQWMAYTIFYDSWEKGTGERFRWKYAQFPHFHHHFTTPLPGTVTRIRIFYP